MLMVLDHHHGCSLVFSSQITTGQNDDNHKYTQPHTHT